MFIMKNINENVENAINSLLVEENAKKVLRAIKSVFAMSSENARSNSVSLLIEAGEGCGASSYSEAYSAIVDNSFGYANTGNETYLELVFPKNNEADEKLFYASPKRLATSSNRFYGTMLISFKEFSGADLIKSCSFNRLLSFVEENKDNIHFVFHILPEFNAKGRLISKLREVTNVEAVTLGNPGIDEAYKYTISRISETKTDIEDDALGFLKTTCIPKVIKSKSFKGFKSFDSFADRIYYEAARESRNGEIILTHKLLENVIVKYDECLADESAAVNDGFGFRI